MKGLVILISALFLTGCSLFSSKPVDPIIIYKTKPVVCSVAKPAKITPLHVELETIKDVEGIWWVAIDDKSYENLAINNKDVLRYILDMRAYADELQDCINSSNKPELPAKASQQ